MRHDIQSDKASFSIRSITLQAYSMTAIYSAVKQDFTTLWHSFGENHFIHCYNDHMIMDCIFSCRAEVGLNMTYEMTMPSCQHASNSIANKS